MNKITITLHEEELHQLIVVIALMAYDRCAAGIPFEQAKMELIDAVVANTEGMDDQQLKEYGLDTKQSRDAKTP